MMMIVYVMMVFSAENCTGGGASAVGGVGVVVGSFGCRRYTSASTLILSKGFISFFRIVLTANSYRDGVVACRACVLGPWISRGGWVGG